VWNTNLIHSAAGENIFLNSPALRFSPYPWLRDALVVRFAFLEEGESLFIEDAAREKG
jgi:hypothetical protein